MTEYIKCILVDDEQLAIDTLTWQLGAFCEGIKILATFTNPSAAIKYLQTHEVDLCFLDIDMPEMSGFDFIAHWTNDLPFDVIFATAYSEFAIKAFKVSALDYLLKPIDEEELVNTISKYQQSKTKTLLTDQISLFLAQQQSPHTYPDRIALPTIEGVHMVNTKSIIRLQADSNYTTVVVDDGPPILVSKTLKEIEKLMDPKSFFRIHQSHSIDLGRIKLYQRGRGGNVTLQDGTLLPVSKHRKDELLKRLGL